MGEPMEPIERAEEGDGGCILVRTVISQQARMDMRWTWSVPIERQIGAREGKGLREEKADKICTRKGPANDNIRTGRRQGRKPWL